MDVTDMTKIDEAARLLLQRFGADAVAQAELRIAELRRAHEAEAAARWRLIAARVKVLADPATGHLRQS